eukprot:2691552-Alexandrium_andersonii.AAC.1
MDCTTSTRRAWGHGRCRPRPRGASHEAGRPPASAEQGVPRQTQQPRHPAHRAPLPPHRWRARAASRPAATGLRAGAVPPRPAARPPRNAGRPHCRGPTRRCPRTRGRAGHA